MVDTVRTQAYLTGTSFADGQAAGAITPQQVRDFIVSTGTRCMVNVNDYGADPTGVIDSTTAFQNAMAVGPCYVPAFVPGTTTASLYRLNNCIVPNGASIHGERPPGYFGGRGSYGVVTPPTIAPVSLATPRIFNVNQAYNVGFFGLTIDCSKVSGFIPGVASVCDGISAGVSVMTVRDCMIVYANNGVGGVVPTAIGQGYISGTTLTITSLTSGAFTTNGLATGAYIETTTLNQITPLTAITALGTGSGGVGTYTVNASQTVGSSGSPITVHQIVGSYPWSSSLAILENNFLDSCVTGMNGLIDGQVRGGMFTGCQNGILWNNAYSAGAVDVTGVRFEWCGRTNVADSILSTGPGSGITVISNVGNVQIRGCYFDTNGVSAITLGSTSYIGAGAWAWTICDNVFQASGCNPTINGGTTLAASSAHIQFLGFNANILLTGNISPAFQENTDVGSFYSPTAFAYFSGTNTGISFVGNDLSGYTGSTNATVAPPNTGNSSNTLWRTGTPPTTTTGQGTSGYIVSRNFGTGTAAQDIDSR